MKLTIRFGLTVIAVGAIVGCSSGSDWQEPNLAAISQDDVVRVVTRLADDDMLGRAAFGEGAPLAAAFLTEEFAATGVQPLPWAEGYEQSFTVFELAPSDPTVTVDGTAVASERILARMGSQSVAWSAGDVPVHVVPDDGNLMQTVFQPMREGQSAVVLAGPSHEDAFAQLAGGFLGRPNRVMDLAEEGPSVVVVLSAGSVSESSAVDVQLTAEVSERPLANVVGHLPGRRPNEYVLFSAHYDHIGIQRSITGDSIANGANDDASGTAAVVALAKYFAARGTPERTLLFAAFTAEEAGGYGSRYFSQQLNPDQVVAMFNIEMIGKPAVEGPNSAWITGFERSDFGSLLQAAVEGTEFSFHPDPYPDQNLFYRSDNATLARLGVPAHSISTTPIDVDPDYHRVTDHVETLDLDHMTAAIRAIAAGAETMVTGEATPTRVDPSTVN